MGDPKNMLSDFIGAPRGPLSEEEYEVVTTGEGHEWCVVPEERLSTNLGDVFPTRDPFEPTLNSPIRLATFVGINTDVAIRLEKEEYGRLRAAVLESKDIEYGGHRSDVGGAREAMVADLATTARSYMSDVEAHVPYVVEVQRRFRGGLAVFLELVASDRKLSTKPREHLEVYASRAWATFRDGGRSVDIADHVGSVLDAVAPSLRSVQGPGLQATLEARDQILTVVRPSEARRLTYEAVVEALKWRTELPEVDGVKIEEVLLPRLVKATTDSAGSNRHAKNKGIIRALIADSYVALPDVPMTKVYAHARDRYEAMQEEKFAEDFRNADVPLLDEDLMRKYFVAPMDTEWFGVMGWGGKRKRMRLG
jgi:hypothetical protein